MNPDERSRARSAHTSRRQFLQSTAAGIGTIALANSPASAESSPTHFVPRVKRVIHIHLAGGPSQLELFDYKPTLEKLHGQPCPTSRQQNEQ